MSDLIGGNYPMLLVMSRFGIPLGFGEKNVKEVCKMHHVDACTFLTVVNFLSDDSHDTPILSDCFSMDALISYLQNSHTYFLEFRLPNIREKLVDAIVDAGACPLEPTTVVDLTPMGTGGDPVVVREGRGSLQALGL